MATPMESLEKEALQLPKDAKARLVLDLLDSMDERSDLASSDSEQAWVAEANRRYEAYSRGEDKAIPAEDVFAELREDDL